MSSVELQLPDPVVRTADRTLTCFSCGTKIPFGARYALFPAFAPGQQSVMVPVCTGHGWANTDVIK